MDKSIEYILEVARQGGITKAAHTLFITPSALSKFVLQKEKELGVRIFRRDGNKFILTYAGERYVEMLRELRDRRAQMRLEMGRLRDLYMGRLRIGFQMSFAERMTTAVLPSLRQHYPDIKVSLKELDTKHLLQELQENQLDAAVMLTGENTSDYFNCRRILDSPVVVVSAADSLLADIAEKREGFSYPWLSDTILQKQLWITDTDSRSLRQYAPQLAGHDAEPLESDVTVTNARTALMCVSGGMGLIILPELLVRELHYEKDTTLFSYGAEEIHSSLSIVSDPRTVLTDEINVLEKILSACYRHGTDGE